MKKKLLTTHIEPCIRKQQLIPQDEEQFNFLLNHVLRFLKEQHVYPMFKRTTMTQYTDRNEYMNSIFHLYNLCLSRVGFAGFFGHTSYLSNNFRPYLTYKGGPDDLGDLRMKFNDYIKENKLKGKLAKMQGFI